MRKSENGYSSSRGKISIFVLTTFLLLLASSYPAFNQQNLRYYLEIDEQTWDAFYVNISIKNNKFDKLLCSIPEISPWLSLNHQVGSDISKFDVSDRFGDKVLFSQINTNCWLIDAKDRDIVNISYKVSNRKDQVLGERLSRRFARVDFGSIFLFIRELKTTPIYLVVRVPHGWKLATGLHSADQIFEYNVDNYEQLINNPLYMARFEEIYFRLKDRTCYIIIDGTKTTSVGKLSSIAAKVAYYQTRLLKDIPFEHYYFIFKFFPGRRQFVSKAYQNTSIYYLTYDSIQDNWFDICKEIGSNFFRVWNGNQFYPISMKWDELTQNPCTGNFWFCYGLSDYYGCLSLVRAGAWSEDEFINYSIKIINRLLCYPEDEMPSLAILSSHIMKYDYGKSIAFIRLKGYLIGMLLDLKIRELTNNKRSLDDVIFFMNKWFGSERTGYYEGDILRAIGAVTGADLTSFFDLYIYGTTRLPLIEALQSGGIFLEAKPDTIPDLGEIIVSSDGNLITRIIKNNPLEMAGMKIGDKLLSLNDHQITFPQQIEQIVDTLKVGQEISVAIQREGVSLMLIAKVAGKPCTALTLLNAEPQTELQQTIRKLWLAKQLP